MNHLVLFFIVLLCLTSCGAGKKVSQELQAESRIESYDSVALASRIDRMVKDALTESIKSLTEQDIRIERTIYSEPDSTGAQYVIEEETVNIKSTTEENRILAVDIIIEENTQVDSIATSASLEDLEMEAITDTKAGLPWWQKTLMMFGAAVLLFIIIRVILKFI